MSRKEKVASSDGNGYSLKFQKEGVWKTFRDKKYGEYRIPPNYTPHHMKVFKTACKLFLGAKLPGYIQNPKELVNAVFSAVKPSNNVQFFEGRERERH